MPARLSPTLLTLALGFASCAGYAATAPSDSMRDEHARAIKAAINIGAKRVAERQIEEWAKAGYTDTGAPSIREALKIAFDRQFDPAFKEPAPPAGNVPKIIAELSDLGSGIDQILHLVNEARRIIDNDGPAPLVKPTEERLVSANHTIAKLASLFEKEFATGLAAVKSHKDEEKKLDELDENVPANKKVVDEINHKAVDLRLDCMRAFYFAHLVLREVATRGADFGLDPKPANDVLNNFTKANREMLSQWDFSFGDMHPQLQLYIAIAICEGARQKVQGYSVSDGEEMMTKITGMDLNDPEAKIPPAVKEMIRTIQIKAWGNLLRWELELGTDAARDRGLVLFLDFQKFMTDGKITLDSPDADRAGALGQVFLLAGRLNAAKGNTTVAQQLWGQVRNPKNPMRDVATKWIGFHPGGAQASTNPWGEEPIAAEPSSALSVGQALLREAQNANAKQARDYALSAAAGLRNGVLGLASTAYSDQFVENAAPLYRSYTSALLKLDMSFHAAAASQEGLRQIRARITEKNNPWKDKSGAWTLAGQQVNKLIDTAISAAANLHFAVRSPATNRLKDETVMLAQQINPEMVGKGLEWSINLGTYNEGDYARCIEEARSYVKKYPEDFVKTASLILRARLSWIDKLDSPTASAADKTKLVEMQKELLDNVTKLKDYIAKHQDAKGDEAKTLGQLNVAVRSAEIKSKLKAKKYDEVFTDLGPEFWKKPPTDPDLGIAMLKILAQAVNESHMQLSGMEKVEDKPKPVDAAKLAPAWARYCEAMREFRKYAPRYTNGDPTALKGASYRLARVAQYSSSQADMNVRAKNDAEAMTKMTEEAKRLFADFMEPFIDDKSPPSLLQGVAQTLWEIDEKKGAARLFELYKVRLDADPQVKSFKADASSILNPIAAAVTSRTEFKKPWDEIVDYLSDPPGYMVDLIRGGSAAVAGRGQKRDYDQGLTRIEALKKLVADAGYLDGEGKKKIQESLDSLRLLVQNLAYTINLDTKLAQYYRETGQAEKAVKLYKALYEDYDPTNATYAAGFVEGVLEALSTDAKGVNKEVISGARTVALQNLRYFESQGNQRAQYWISWLQVLELSKYMEETKEVAKKLQFTIINKGTPRDDLHEPVVAGDDPRVMRPDNAGSVAIAQRYLNLFEGIQDLKRPFRIDLLDVQGKSTPLFVDTEAPAVNVQVETNEGDEQVLFKIDDAGKAAAPAPAAVPAPVDPTPAQP